MTSETEEAVARVEEFERHPALASWIERMANSATSLSLGEWMIFLDALNRALASERERADRAERERDEVRAEFVVFMDDTRKVEAFHFEKLSASQAEVERLRRERDEAGALAAWVRKRNCDTPQEAEAWHGKMLDRIEAAEARATRAEGLLEEAGEVLGHLVEEFGESIASYHKVGPCLTTRSDGQEYVSAGIILDREPLVEAARAFLAKLAARPSPNHRGMRDD